MSILTTSQLTFYDVKDSYSIYMDREYFGVACDKNGYPTSESIYTLNYGGFMGTDRVAVSCTVDSTLPSGMTLHSLTESTVNSEGSIQFKMSQSLNFKDVSSISIKITFTTGDGFCFERYITFIKSMVGADGQAGVNGAGFHRVITKIRRFTNNQWNQYNYIGHSENWSYQTDEDTPSSSLSNNNHIKVGDTAYVLGVITDKNSISCMLIGTVEAVNSSGVRLKTTAFIVDGQDGKDGQDGEDGQAGKDAITFQIYSSQGFVFKEDIDQIELNTIAFDGDKEITNAVYKWSWYNNTNQNSFEVNWDGNSTGRDGVVILESESSILKMTKVRDIPLSSIEDVIGAVIEFKSNESGTVDCFTITEDDVSYLGEGGWGIFLGGIVPMVLNITSVELISDINITSNGIYFANAYNIADPDTPLEYVSKFSNKQADDYVEITNTLDKSFIVKKSDTYALSPLKCTMITADGKQYDDYVLLTDENIIYTSMVKFFDGSNVFGASDQYLIAYIELYKNNQLVKGISSSRYNANQNNSVDPDGVINTDLGGNFSDGERIYFIYKEDTLYKAVLGEYQSGSWNVVSDEENQYVYVNNLYPDVQSNVIVISKNSVSRSRNIDFKIYEKIQGNENNYDNKMYISSANVTVIDLNDPVVGIDAPLNPKYGQLWLDTSSTPYELKIYTQIAGQDAGEWVYFIQQEGNSIYTSIDSPDNCNVGDLWILPSGSVYGQYAEGSVLKAVYDESGNLMWVDAMFEVTETIVNVKETFNWDEDGIKIRKKVTSTDENGKTNTTYPFYVSIDSEKMGFHSAEYNESGQVLDDVEVVHIGNKSATIQNATFEGSDGTIFNNNATFNQPVSFLGLVLKKEQNGSWSLAI